MTLSRVFFPPRWAGLLLLALYGLLSACACPPRCERLCSGPAASLASLARDPAPWRLMEAYSEQRQPVYLGSTPRELELGLSPKDQGRALLPSVLKAAGESQAALVRDALLKTNAALPEDRVEFEAWPARDDAGRLTWAFARYRVASLASDQADDAAPQWRWLDADKLARVLKEQDDENATLPMLPVSLDPANPEQAGLIFKDFLQLPGLYDKPVFGDCVWTAPEQDAQPACDAQAWLSPALRVSSAQRPPAPLCRVVPPPARLNGRPLAWILRSSAQGLTWPSDIGWKETFETLPSSQGGQTPVIKTWPANFTNALKRDILTLDGEKVATYPLSGRTLRFTAKNNADPRNQLLSLVEYLEERYKALEIPTQRIAFTWRGMPQANLMARIPGSLPPESNRPILMADHFDTAFCEDTYKSTGQRISAPGADDNLSATATLLRAAELLRRSKPKHDIWLVHFTGEEFPADDLGARAFLNWLLREKRDIGGLVLMDMIGWRSGGDSLFQLNPGDNAPSLRLAAAAFDAAKAQRAKFKPVLRPRFDPRSYLYNTDGLVFSDAGYPVVLFNEHINRLENLNRIGYHHTTDASGKIDWSYLTTVSKVAIETVARLAQCSGAAQ